MLAFLDYPHVKAGFNLDLRVWTKRATENLDGAKDGRCLGEDSMIMADARCSRSGLSMRSFH
jgi:hypothetical protein